VQSISIQARKDLQKALSALQDIVIYLEPSVSTYLSEFISTLSTIISQLQKDAFTEAVASQSVVEVDVAENECFSSIFKKRNCSYQQLST
jgi:predicted nucleic acid-binding protein